MNEDKGKDLGREAHPASGCLCTSWHFSVRSLPVVFGKISQSEELCLALESVEWISFLFCANSLVC